MKKFPAPFFLFALFAFFAAGCSSTSTMVGLQAELTGITRNSAGVAEASWRVVNPNIVPYLVAQTSHRVYLDGVLVGTLTDREALAVTAQSKTDRTSALTLAGAAGERALAAAAGAGSAAYRLESNITIRLYGDTTDRTELRASGTVPVGAK